MNNFTQRKRYLGSIGVPSVVNAIFDRTLSTPDDFFLKVGGDGASLPPVLVPFWGDLDGSDGVWQHWFCNRKATIVSALHEFSFLVFEDARTLDQFVDDWILTCIEGDEGVGEDARRLGWGARGWWAAPGGGARGAQNRGGSAPEACGGASLFLFEAVQSKLEAASAG